MNFNLKTTTIAAKSNILDSAQVRYVRGGVTLDAAQVTADGNGLKKMLAGTVLVKVGTKFRQYIAAVAASKALGVVGDKNAITYTAVNGGTAGNAIKIALINPGANSQPLEVTVVNDEIRVSLATSGAGALTTTGAEVVAAINASIACKTLVTAALTVGAGNDGSGACAAIAATALASGAAANGTPSCILEDAVDFTTFTQSGGVAYADQVVPAIDGARVITSRLPVAPDAYVKASLPGISFV